jgi:hypothetical protein
MFRIKLKTEGPESIVSGDAELPHARAFLLMLNKTLFMRRSSLSLRFLRDHAAALRETRSAPSQRFRGPAY